MTPNARSTALRAAVVVVLAALTAAAAPGAARAQSCTYLQCEIEVLQANCLPPMGDWPADLAPSAVATCLCCVDKGVGATSCTPDAALRPQLELWSGGERVAGSFQAVAGKTCSQRQLHTFDRAVKPGSYVVKAANAMGMSRPLTVSAPEEGGGCALTGGAARPRAAGLALGVAGLLALVLALRRRGPIA